MNENKKQALERAALVINQRVNRIHLANRQALMGNMGLDAKRTKAWCEYGYPEQVDFNATYNAWRRGGLAFSAVKKTIDKCWSDFPVVRDNDDSEELSAWEKDVASILDDSFYHEFKEADKMRLVGKYSALILYYSDTTKDKKQWNQPLNGTHRLDRVQAVWQSAITKQVGTDWWTFNREDEQGNLIEVLSIHDNRVFILGDMTPDGMSFLEPCFNNLINLEKIEGGGGESFAKNAARQMGVNFEKEINLADMAKSYGVDQSELVDIMNQAVEDLNVGNDMMLITQGASVTPLVSTVPDPRSHFDINVDVCAATWDIPRKILLGNISGERASTEDEKQWGGTCQARRINTLSIDLKRFIEKLMRHGIIKALANYYIEWNELVKATPEDLLDQASKMADIVQKTYGLFDQPVISANEIREKVGLAPLEIEEVLPDDTDSDNIEQY